MRLDRLATSLVVALLIFLPFSAWLVSFTGLISLALIRDVLLLTLILIVLANLKPLWRNDWANWGAVIFICGVILSYVHREESVVQWLRGVRYWAEPVVLFLTIRLFGHQLNKNLLLKVVMVTALIVGMIGVVEFFNPTILAVALQTSVQGYLGQVHTALLLVRLQSTLAGPNALGLYLMVVLLLLPALDKMTNRWWLGGIFCLILAIFLLTFSRSSFVGLFVGLMAMLVAGRSNPGQNRWFMIGLSVAFILIVGLFVWRPQELTRYGSNTLRLEQYQRIYNQLPEIGFWGRGAGSAGLVSQFRFDGGSNRFSENTYLDIYESSGVISVVGYIIFWVAIIWSLLTRKETLLAGASLALVVAGLFIDHYTGQAALWTLLIFVALATIISGSSQEQNNTP